ncbi:MAG: hypothetical protein QW512_01885 [Thermofilaceae archaeon]
MVEVSSVWLEGARVNSILYRSFVVKGRGEVVAAILYADDGNLYLAFSRSVAGVIRELVLPSPFVDQSRRRMLRFTVGSRKVTSTGYLVAAGSRYDLDLLTEEVRFIVEASLGVGVKVRKHRSPEAPPPKGVLTEEERKLLELAPLDVPSDLLAEEGGATVTVEEEGEKEGEEDGAER